MRFRRLDPIFDGGFSIFDTVLEHVSATVGRFPVETGGALLGDYTTGVISRFIFDEDAETTATTYVPSLQLNEKVNAAEFTHRLQFKGVLHSHPGNFDMPSGPDANSFFQGLKANPELSRYLAPIVTFHEGEDRDNKIILPGGGWATFYVVMRGEGNNVKIHRTMPDVIYFARDCRALTSLLGIDEPEFITGDDGTVSNVTAIISLTDDLELMLIADGTYPKNPPRAILHRQSTSQTTQLTLRWSAAIDGASRLLDSMFDVATTALEFPTKVAFGRHGQVLTDDEKQAVELGLDPILVGDTFETRKADIQVGLFARSKGLLSETLQSQNVLINGAGSVGSYIAEQLVRSGVGSLTLVDPDVVEYANLSRSVYASSDVGSLKVDALSRRLLSINPTLKIHRLARNLHDISETKLEQIFQNAHFVVCAVDDRRAQLLINRWAYFKKKPSVFVGIYAGARSGEVCFIEPPLPCFSCATQFRTVIPEEDQRETDYGTGQLVAEVALGVDIQAITAASIRIVLSRLVKNQDSSLSHFVEGMGKNQFMLMSVDPVNQLIDSIMTETPGQYGYKSIWLKIQEDPECNVCGHHPDIPTATLQVSMDDIKMELEKSASSSSLEVMTSDDGSSPTTPTGEAL